MNRINKFNNIQETHIGFNNFLQVCFPRECVFRKFPVVIKVEWKIWQMRGWMADMPLTLRLMIAQTMGCDREIRKIQRQNLSKLLSGRRYNIYTSIKVSQYFTLDLLKSKRFQTISKLFKFKNMLNWRRFLLPETHLWHDHNSLVFWNYSKLLHPGGFQSLKLLKQCLV